MFAIIPKPCKESKGSVISPCVPPNLDPPDIFIQKVITGKVSVEITFQKQENKQKRKQEGAKVKSIKIKDGDILVTPNIYNTT